MDPQKVIVRFQKVAEQATGPVTRIVGLVKARDMIGLFDAADLEANPRSAKAGSVTEDIQESIVDTPEIFPFMTKGVLVGSSSYKPLQRNRYELEFENPKIEGILDGGHNMLAIGTHILGKAVDDPRIVRRARDWASFKELWTEHRQAIERLRKGSAANEDNNVPSNGELDFLIPLEILVPSDLEDEEIVEQFNTQLLAISSARNNNVELTLETKANKKGFYEDLRNALPSSIAQRIEWKTNAGGDIKVRDLIALAWIPLSVLDDDFIPVIPPQNIYRNKGECAKLFDQLMSNDLVSEATEGEYTRQLIHPSIQSALRLAAEFPALYDKIYQNFPSAYNNDGEGKFGRIKVVKMAKDMRRPPTSHFTAEKVEYSYPDGLIMPLVYGLKKLIEVDKKGCVRWKMPPSPFLDRHLPQIVKRYKVILTAFDFDPQKVGKHEGSYALVQDAYDTALLRMGKSN